MSLCLVICDGLVFFLIFLQYHFDPTNFCYVSVLQHSALQLNGVCEEIIALACLEVDMSELQSHLLASSSFSGRDSTGLSPVHLVHVTCIFASFPPILAVV